MRLEGHVRVTIPDGRVIGRYDGADYVFKAGEPLDVPEIVAQHVFGFGLTDKSAALARLGWATKTEEIEQAMERLFQVQFDDPPEMIEVPRKQRAPKKAGDARPLVNAGGPKVIVAGSVTDPAMLTDGTTQADEAAEGDSADDAVF